MTPDEMYKKYKDSVFRVCRRYATNDLDAEDMLQESFIKIFRAYEGFDHKAKVFTWIYRIAVNTCLDQIRAAKRNKAESIDYLEEIPCKNTKRDITDIHLTLNKLLKSFSKENREMLFYYYAEGLKHDEIADIMGVSRVAISKRFKKLESRFKHLSSLMLILLLQKQFSGNIK